ncbi:MAG TPA: carbohydrate ABC transporter permease [Fimbriimonadaceae bacterium]|nr:carbohydrate ABC transporter permease [Fimbriimonadaceae bacterium]
MKASTPLRGVIYVVLFALSLIFLIPFLWLISTSLKPLDQTMSNPPVWIPHPVQFRNFPDAVRAIPFFAYALNTVLLCVVCVSGAVFSASVVAYAFARLRWWGRDVFFWITVATMMIPFPVVMVPLFAMFRHLDWIGTYRPLWVPVWFGNAFNIFLLRQFFRTIPNELTEAATIDGASQWKIFWEVVMPLSKPALAIIALFTVLGTWNDFLSPLIYLVTQKTFTLSLGLQFYQSQHNGVVWNQLFAATTLMILPIIVLFFFTQKLFIQGVKLTGIK